MRRIAALLVVAVTTTLGAATTVAKAAGPEHELVSATDTFYWDFCGFPVMEQFSGSLLFVSWYDANGVRERQLVAAPGTRITWTNTDTGASVSSPNPFVVHKIDNPDGSATIAFTGLVFAIPGHGRVTVDSGRDVIVWSNGSVDLLTSSGPTDDLCDALTAAIG